MNNVDAAKDALRNLTVTELNNMVPFIKNLLSLRRRTAARQNMVYNKARDKYNKAREEYIKAQDEYEKAWDRFRKLVTPPL